MAFSALLSLKSFKTLFHSPLTFCPISLLFRLFYSFFSLWPVRFIWKINKTSHIQLDLLWCWGWTLPDTGTRKSARLRRDMKKEKWTGAGRVKKKKEACVKANSLLVSFCLISCTVGHCSIHCIYSKAQCHTPLWKRALRSVVSTHPAVSTLPSSIHPVPLLSIYSWHFCEFWVFFIVAKVQNFETCFNQIV